MTDPITPKSADDAPTLLTAWKAAQARLKTGRIDSPAIDARLLLEAAAGASRMDILTDPYRPITTDQLRVYEAMVDRRLKREPVSRIVGKKGFWKIMLNVTPDVLSPRPDTETLMDVAMLAFSKNEAFDAIDLGTGSGAILLALLAERPAARGVGTDISSEALAVAKENAANLDLNERATFLRTEWAAGFGDASFDLVLSNPPYIPTGHIATLDPEVRDHDPHLALDGGPDGLQAYRDLAPEVKRILKPLGVFAVEIGFDQGPQVKALFEAAGFTDVKIIKDLGDRDRVVTNGPDPRTNPIPQD
ncbi:MAG: peptide chain release factor N(5)-glutamine methyltransferase [Candidatus Brevundimonas colombiensis]|uniref:Release factor glutamine methyltransferase n=1 Tax=Candidatus Brevundimonas colombiensis TaxID=3121376 RepID=A0AAJ6BKX6_9CAUL|nr:peptide chain release factor N(5)-glutamine methyltransferase [Brevundimonas sp.]WEK41345.1 MAG: peptide chain release factor N(5)-glutamine methyltransferase [Brevundimonas sp.]